MNFDHKDLGYHLLQLCPKVVKHSEYVNMWTDFFRFSCSRTGQNRLDTDGHHT